MEFNAELPRYLLASLIFAAKPGGAPDREEPQVSKISKENETTVTVDAAGVPIPVAKKNKNMLVAALIAAGGTTGVFLLTPLAPFALVAGMLAFGAGGLVGKAIS